MEKVKNVLLIDDDDITNLLNKKMLERSGIAKKITVLKNGKEGINYFNITSREEDLPELIFLDLNMPIMNGFQFLDAFKHLPYRDRTHAKIVVLSSSEDNEDINMAKSLGCDDYISKPLTQNRLNDIMEKHFNLVE